MPSKLTPSVPGCASSSVLFSVISDKVTALSEHPVIARIRLTPNIITAKILFSFFISPPCGEGKGICVLFLQRLIQYIIQVFVEGGQLFGDVLAFPNTCKHGLDLHPEVLGFHHLREGNASCILESVDLVCSAG